VDFENKELVFAGYGFTAPEFGWDDYKGIDVKGKMVVILDGEPPATAEKRFGGRLLPFLLSCQGRDRQKARCCRYHRTDGYQRIFPFAQWWQQKDFTTLAVDLGEFQTHLTVKASQRPPTSLP